MEKHDDVTSILSKLNLQDIEETISQPYHKTGPGKPPRSPLGIFKALIVKQLRNIPSDRELYRRLWNDEQLRMICDIEEHEKPYHPSQLTMFRNKVGPERLEAVMNSLLEELVEGDIIKGETLALNATFIKAWSRRDPADDSHGLSDTESCEGRDGKTYDLGYKAHVAVVVESDMPVAAVVASANENEKRNAEELLGKASEVVEGIKAVVADSQYSSEKVRGLVEELGAEPVIPYMSNHKRGEKVLRVDRFFRVSGPEEEDLRVGGASVERVNSRLDLVGLGDLKLRGLKNVIAGNKTGAHSVKMMIDGDLVEEKEVTVDAGLIEKVTFTYQTDVEGTHQVKVGDLEGSFKVEKQMIPGYPLHAIIVGLVAVSFLAWFKHRRSILLF